MPDLENFSTMHNNTALADALGKLKQALAQASMSNALDAQTSATAQSYLQQAIREVNMPVPSKPTLLDHLDSARECLAESASAAAIAEALTQASATVERLF